MCIRQSSSSRVFLIYLANFKQSYKQLKSAFNIKRKSISKPINNELISDVSYPITRKISTQILLPRIVKLGNQKGLLFYQLPKPMLYQRKKWHFRTLQYFCRKFPSYKNQQRRFLDPWIRCFLSGTQCFSSFNRSWKGWYQFCSWLRPYQPCPPSILRRNRTFCGTWWLIYSYGWLHG